MQTTKRELYEYQRSRSVIDLGPNHLHSIFLNFFSSITADFNTSSAIKWAIQDQWSSGFFSYEKMLRVQPFESGTPKFGLGLPIFYRGGVQDSYFQTPSENPALEWSVSHQPLVRKQAYLDHRRPGGSAFFPWLLTPGSVPGGWG